MGRRDGGAETLFNFSGTGRPAIVEHLRGGSDFVTQLQVPIGAVPNTDPSLSSEPRQISLLDLFVYPSTRLIK